MTLGHSAAVVFFAAAMHNSPVFFLSHQTAPHPHQQQAAAESGLIIELKRAGNRLNREIDTRKLSDLLHALFFYSYFTVIFFCREILDLSLCIADDRQDSSRWTTIEHKISFSFFFSPLDIINIEVHRVAEACNEVASVGKCEGSKCSDHDGTPENTDRSERHLITNRGGHRF